MRNILFNANELKNERITGLASVSQELFRNFRKSKVLKLNTCFLKKYRFEKNFYYNVRRLAWMQFVVPRIMNELKSEIFFSPLTEAPIFNKIKSVVMVHDLISIKFYYSPWVKSFYSLYIPAVLRNSKLIITNSNCTSNELIDMYRLNPEKIHTLKLGYDKRNIFSLEVEREDFFLILGSHYYHKNIPNILRAIKYVKEKGFSFIFAGQFDKNLTPLHIKLARELEISELCIWEGWVDNKKRRDLLNRCKALIMPSLWEGFGIPSLEAMACGTPVIGSITGAMPEVLGELGILVNPNNAKEIADAIIQIKNNTKISQRMSIEGPKRASIFNCSDSIKSLEKMIIEI